MKNSLILNPTFSPASGGTRNVRHNKIDVIIHGITESRMEIRDPRNQTRALLPGTSLF